MLRKIALSCIICATLTACVGDKQLYSWGSYPKALLAYSKNPEQSDKFTAALEQTIRKAEDRKNVPPGLYAEYGYMLLDQQRVPEAVAYFGKERDRWPESASLMNRIIERLSKRSNGGTSTVDSAPASAQ